MMAERVTPTSFAPHLLAVLGDLTAFDEGVAVAMKETYAPVCERMGLAEDALGASSHGSPNTHRKIGIAMRQMRDRGLTRYEKKGQWGLTPEGAKEARAVVGDAAPGEATDVDVEEFVRAFDDTGEAEEPKGNLLEFPFGGDGHPYSQDPYIRGLAIRQTSCFGAYSAGDRSVCARCPLAAECVAGVTSRKAEIAADLEAEERALAARIAAEKVRKAKRDASVDELVQGFGDEPDPPAPGHTAPAAPRSTHGTKGKFTPTPDQVIEDAFAQRQAICAQCGGKVEKDEACKWVQDEGMFHNDCIDLSEATPADQLAKP